MTLRPASEARPSNVLENLHLRSSLPRDELKRRLRPLRHWLLQPQHTYWHEGLSALIPFEGWAAAVKESAIRTLTRRLGRRDAAADQYAAPPWTVVEADDERRARLRRLDTVVGVLEKDLAPEEHPQ